MHIIQNTSVYNSHYLTTTTVLKRYIRTINEKYKRLKVSVIKPRAISYKGQLGTELNLQTFCDLVNVELDFSAEFFCEHDHRAQIRNNKTGISKTKTSGGSLNNISQTSDEMFYELLLNALYQDGYKSEW